MMIQVFGNESASAEHLVIECQDSAGREVKFLT
jgi:hypothetical protein